MTNPDNLKMIPVHGFDERGYGYQMKEYQDERDGYLKYELEKDQFRRDYPKLVIPESSLLDDDDDTFEYAMPSRVDFGMESDVLRSLLDKVGAEGSHPAIATALFRAGIKSPMAPPEYLYMPRLDLMDQEAWYSHLFAVYLRGQDDERLHGIEPDALVTLQGRNRKPYKGYESVVVDTWINRTTLDSGMHDLSAIGRRVLELGVTSAIESYFAMVEPDTKVLQLDNSERVYKDSEWTTIEQLGIEPDEFDEEPKEERYSGRGRLEVIKNIDEYDFPDLIRSYKKLFKLLRLDVDALDMESGEHYSYEMYGEKIKHLNALMGMLGDDQITGISIDREDRPEGYWYNADYYVNNWGDMTIRLNIEKESITTTYTMVIFMDPKSPTYFSSLNKYHAPTKKYGTLLQSEAAHALATLRDDPLRSETGVNDVDDDECAELVRLIDSMSAVHST
ncbi:MAG: hypothetical protein JWO07_382 [Candidatus Saccharibacteria bacterium]|nr:hypothetical protein [Candidatus Saccharibacteria bacterium]